MFFQLVRASLLILYAIFCQAKHLLFENCVIILKALIIACYEGYSLCHKFAQNV